MNLKHKVALITGGARIGISVAEELAREGCHLVLTYRHSRQAAEEGARKAEIMGTRSLLIKADVTKETDVKNAMKAVKKEFGRLDILVNMASTYGKFPLQSIDGKMWDEHVNANLKSAFLATQQAVPLLSKNGGRVVNIADWLSSSGRPRYKDYLLYYTAKGGVESLTEALALELAPEVLVNAIAPGPILPPPDMPKKEREAVIKATPLRKWGGPEEIAKAVVYLCQTDFVTGECIRVDGGRHLY